LSFLYRTLPWTLLPTLSPLDYPYNLQRLTSSTSPSELDQHLSFHHFHLLWFLLLKVEISFVVHSSRPLFDFQVLAFFVYFMHFLKILGNPRKSRVEFSFSFKVFQHVYLVFLRVYQTYGFTTLIFIFHRKNFRVPARFSSF